MPRGFSASVYPPLVDVLTDGTIVGVLVDQDGRYHHALWVTPGANPALHQLPDTWVPTDLAGQWVTGRIGTPTDRVFLRSWTQAFAVDGPQPLYANGISGNGTFTVNTVARYADAHRVRGQTTHSVVGLEEGLRVNDVVGTRGGQVLVRRDGSSIEVISCALSLPAGHGHHGHPARAAGNLRRRHEDHTTQRSPCNSDGRGGDPHRIRGDSVKRIGSR